MKHEQPLVKTWKISLIWWMNWNAKIGLTSISTHLSYNLILTQIISTPMTKTDLTWAWLDFKSKKAQYPKGPHDADDDYDHGNKCCSIGSKEEKENQGRNHGTTISNIEIISNDDDGIEFFGGNVDVENILIFNQKDDAIDIDEAYAALA